jgi:hypothetical protein
MSTTGFTADSLDAVLVVGVVAAGGGVAGTAGAAARTIVLEAVV